MARIQAGQGRHDPAADLFLKAASLSKDPLFQSSMYYNAALELGRGVSPDDDRRMSLLHRALKRNPTRPEIGFQLAKIYADRKEFGKAGALLMSIREQNPDIAEVDQLLREIMVQTRASGK